MRSSSTEGIGHKEQTGKYAFGSGIDNLVTYQLAALSKDQSAISLSGSNQAREGRLVDALAVRGDERRDTLR